MKTDLGEALKQARLWLAADPDPTTRQELQALLANDPASTICERFRQILQFGTSGVRGLLGAGPSRMNHLTVRVVTAGVASVLTDRATQADQRGVVVAFDARLRSAEFADEACRVLAAYGIKAIAYSQPQPTPLLAFAILQLNAAAGIMITASHNPPAYSGLKVYWDKGAQIIPPIDDEISFAMSKLSDPAAVPRMDLARAKAEKLLLEVPKELVEQYLARLQHAIPSNSPLSALKEPRIVFTPLHGVSGLIRTALKLRKFENVSAVAEQEIPDGRFPTISDPNPENTEAFTMALDQARREGAELVLASDPDGDRLGVAVRVKGDEYRILSGDEVGVLLATYLLDGRRRAGSLPSNGFVVTTIVSSALLERIASVYGVRCEYTLTGFKWIWQRSLELETAGWEFLFAYEEAIGYSVTNIVHDKDGISAAVLLAELQRSCNSSGATLLETLDEIYRQYGVSCTKQIALSLNNGWKAQMPLDFVRTSPPLLLNGSNLVRLTDLRSQEVVRLPGGTLEAATIPRGEVIQLLYASGLRVAIRPSGTEPKLKLYFELVTTVAEGASVAEARVTGMSYLNTCSRELASYLGTPN